MGKVFFFFLAPSSYGRYFHFHLVISPLPTGAALLTARGGDVLMKCHKMTCKLLLLSALLLYPVYLRRCRRLIFDTLINSTAPATSPLSPSRLGCELKYLDEQETLQLCFIIRLWNTLSDEWVFAFRFRGETNLEGSTGESAVIWGATCNVGVNLIMFSFNETYLQEIEQCKTSLQYFKTIVTDLIIFWAKLSQVVFRNTFFYQKL